MEHMRDRIKVQERIAAPAEPGLQQLSGVQARMDGAVEAALDIVM
jgi:hypothetical protein